MYVFSFILFVSLLSILHCFSSSYSSHCSCFLKTQFTPFTHLQFVHLVRYLFTKKITVFFLLLFCQTEALLPIHSERISCAAFIVNKIMYLKIQENCHPYENVRDERNNFHIRQKKKFKKKYRTKNSMRC